MSRLPAMIIHRMRRLGPLTLAGLALAVAALIFQLTVGVSTARHLHALESGSRQMREAASARRSTQVSIAPHAAVQSFYRALPPEKAAPDLLEQIFDAAFENNLSPEHGELKLMKEFNAAFSRYQVVLPVTGTYLNIRSFANRVLKDIPSASLDEISFIREDVKHPEVEARMRFTVYLRSAP